MEIHIDKLPIKRLESIEENGSERFPSDVGIDEKRIDQVRKIDFSFAVERDAKKAKKEVASSAAAPWPWQGLVENLQSAQQELSMIIELINTVETNDVVSVAGMTRPKPLPNEVLSDLSVSAATKLQRLRHLGKYFKQSSKALEQQVARETRFYSALIRLQQNWKVKRQRLAAAAPSGEDFVMELADSSVSDTSVLPRSSMSIVRIDRDSSGMLTVQLPPKSCSFLHFGFLGSGGSHRQLNSSRKKRLDLRDHHMVDANKEASNEDVNECVKRSHSILQKIHQAIFDEQVFQLVNRETLHQSPGVNVIGMQEDLLQLGTGQEASIFLRLSSSEQDDAKQQPSPEYQSSNGENVSTLSDSLEPEKPEEQNSDLSLNVPNPDCFLIYLQQLFLENMLNKSKEKQRPHRVQMPGQSAVDGSGLLSHFCMSIAHRLYSNKVLAELEKLAAGVPYVRLLTLPTWHSRMSSWFLSIIVPQLAVRAGQHLLVDKKGNKNAETLHFHTKIVVTDESIGINGEGAPNAINSYGADSPMDLHTLNFCGCDVADLPTILLQQVTSQVIRWLHEEALVVGMKASRDFLGLYFELEEGNKIGLVAHVDPDDSLGCISWWLVMDDGSVDMATPQGNLPDVAVENRRFLGYLSLEEMYSLVMDLVSLCSSGRNN